MGNKLIIIGCGGHAKSIADVYLYNKPQAEIIFIDSNAKENDKTLGFNVVKDYEITNENVFVAIGDNQKRTEIYKQQKNVCSIISERAYLGKETSIGNGVFIAHNAFVGVCSKVGNNSIINTAAIIEHDCTIGENTHIAPNSTICGKCSIGNNVFIGLGTSLKNGINICSNVIIGAGSVVIKDITEEGTYAGVPAKRIGEFNH